MPAKKKRGRAKKSNPSRSLHLSHGWGRELPDPVTGVYTKPATTIALGDRVPSFATFLRAAKADVVQVKGNEVSLVEALETIVGKSKVVRCDGVEMPEKTIALVGTLYDIAQSCALRLHERRKMNYTGRDRGGRSALEKHRDSMKAGLQSMRACIDRLADDNLFRGPGLYAMAQETYGHTEEAVEWLTGQLVAIEAECKDFRKESEVRDRFLLVWIDQRESILPGASRGLTNQVANFLLRVVLGIDEDVHATSRQISRLAKTSDNTHT